VTLAPACSEFTDALTFELITKNVKANKNPNPIRIRTTSICTRLALNCWIRSFRQKQVSTPTGIISHFVNLQVVVPEAFILGSGELHVDMGSTINLVCIIEKVSNKRENKLQPASCHNSIRAIEKLLCCSYKINLYFKSYTAYAW